MPGSESIEHLAVVPSYDRWLNLVAGAGSMKQSVKENNFTAQILLGITVNNQ